MKYYAASPSFLKTYTLQPGSFKIDLRPVKPAGLPAKSIVVDISANGKTEKIVEW